MQFLNKFQTILKNSNDLKKMPRPANSKGLKIRTILTLAVGNFSVLKSKRPPCFFTTDILKRMWRVIYLLFVSSMFELKPPVYDE